MKYLLFTLPLFAVGCTTGQIDNTTNALDFTSTVSNTLGGMGVPFAGAVGLAATFAGTTIKAWLGKGKEIDKKNATYQAINEIHNNASKIAEGLKDGSVSLEDATKLLPTLVKETTIAVHSAYNVYHEVEKDIAKLRNKKQISKLGK